MHAAWKTWVLGSIVMVVFKTNHLLHLQLKYDSGKGQVLEERKAFPMLLQSQVEATDSFLILVN